MSGVKLATGSETLLGASTPLDAGLKANTSEPHQTSANAFAQSGFSAHAALSSSPFGALGSVPGTGFSPFGSLTAASPTLGSSFGNLKPDANNISGLGAYKPGSTAAIGFGDTGSNSPFAAVTGSSAFGSTLSNFGSLGGGFGTLGAATPLTNFGSGKDGGIVGLRADGASRPFGAPGKKKNEGLEEDEDDEEGFEKVNNESKVEAWEEQKDERFFQQSGEISACHGRFEVLSAN